MFGLGAGELILILALVILFFGARRLPQFARGLGEGIRNFRGALKGEEEEEEEVKQLPENANDQQ